MDGRFVGPAAFAITAIGAAAGIPVAQGSGVARPSLAKPDPIYMKYDSVLAQPDFDRYASLSNRGHAAKVSGPLNCTLGKPAVQAWADKKLFLSVVLDQGAVSAAGAWRKHTCTSGQDWSLTVDTVGTGSLHKGTATAHGLAMLKLNKGGRTVAHLRWTRAITLS